MQTKGTKGRFRAWRDRPRHSLSTIAVILLALGVIAFVAVSATRRPDATAAHTDQSIPLPTASVPPCRPDAPGLIRIAEMLRSDASTVRMVVLGDSTRDDRTGGRALVRALRKDLAPAKVISLGRTAYTLTRYEANPVLQYKIKQLHPELIELSIGIDDLARGTLEAAAFRKDLGGFVTRLHTEVPTAGIILSVPAAIATHDIDGSSYVTPGTAQRATSDLRAAYRGVARTHSYVVLNDVQEKITGTKADPSQPPRFLSDQVHPNAHTAGEIARLITDDVSC